MTSPRRHIEPLFSATDIAERVRTMAIEIAGTMPRDLMIISLLKGSFVFTADLIRALHLAGQEPQLDFMTLSSYQDRTIPSKKITVNRDLSEEVAGRSVLIVDDILESGKTLRFARNLIEERGAGAIKVAVLLEKPGKRKVDVIADFVGFTVPDRFVVGYGLDYANYYRELPFIGVVDMH